MRFLTDGQILETVRQLVRRDDELLAAVAFWGRGAGQQIGISERTPQSAQPTKVLCDLLSGACNPAEIRHLKENGIEAKYRRNLHAKVWMNGNDVVVGSANASTNGLGFEAAGSNIEAAVHLNDKKVAENVKAWFLREWDLAQCIDNALLQTAETLWNRTQNKGRAIEKCLITAYEESELSEQARDCFDQIAPDYYDEPDEIPAADETCYELGPNDMLPTAGTVYMDYSRGTNGEDFEFGEFWEVIHNETLPENGNTLCLLRERSRREFPAPRDCRGRRGIDTMVNCHLRNGNQDSLDLEFRAFYVLQQQRNCLGPKKQCAGCPFGNAGE